MAFAQGPKVIDSVSWNVEREARQLMKRRCAGVDARRWGESFTGAQLVHTFIEIFKLDVFGINKVWWDRYVRPTQLVG